MKKSPLILIVFLLFVGIGISQAANKAKITFTNGKYLQADWVYLYHSNEAARFNKYCRANNRWVAKQHKSNGYLRCSYRGGSQNIFYYDISPSDANTNVSPHPLHSVGGRRPALTKATRSYGYTYGRAYNGLSGNAEVDWYKRGGLIIVRNNIIKKVKICLKSIHSRTCTKWVKGSNIYKKGGFAILRYLVATKQTMPTIGRLKNLYWNGRKIR